MFLEKISNRTQSVIDLELAKSHLRILDNKEDSYIQTLIEAAVSYCETRRELAASSYDVELITDDPSVRLRVPSEKIVCAASFRLEQTTTRTLFYFNEIPTSAKTITYKVFPFFCGKEIIKQASLQMLAYFYENREDRNDTQMRSAHRLLDLEKPLV